MMLQRQALIYSLCRLCSLFQFCCAADLGFFNLAAKYSQFQYIPDIIPVCFKVIDDHQCHDWKLYMIGFLLLCD